MTSLLRRRPELTLAPTPRVEAVLLKPVVLCTILHRSWSQTQNTATPLTRAAAVRAAAAHHNWWILSTFATLGPQRAKEKEEVEAVWVLAEGSPTPLPQHSGTGRTDHLPGTASASAQRRQAASGSGPPHHRRTYKVHLHRRLGATTPTMSWTALSQKPPTGQPRHSPRLGLEDKRWETQP